jgi:hypothetical protein
VVTETEGKHLRIPKPRIDALVDVDWRKPLVARVWPSTAPRSIPMREFSRCAI